MSVYVDDMKAGFGRMIMCHMIADSPAELLGMATKLNLNHNWIQAQGTHREHFDICLSYRKKAVALGAKEVSQLDLGRMIVAKGKGAS